MCNVSGSHTLTGQVERDHHVNGASATGTRADWDDVGNRTGRHPARGEGK
eukprot:gene41208-4532_t